MSCERLLHESTDDYSTAQSLHIKCCFPEVSRACVVIQAIRTACCHTHLLALCVVLLALLGIILVDWPVATFGMLTADGMQDLRRDWAGFHQIGPSNIILVPGRRSSCATMAKVLVCPCPLCPCLCKPAGGIPSAGPRSSCTWHDRVLYPPAFAHL